MTRTNFLPSLLSILLAPASYADCNLKVATTAGQYLEALEKANLRSYQNRSVCEVLNYEFWNCSPAQKKQMEASFNLKEVLGNYCQPHLPPPKNKMSKDQFPKGADLYSWRDPSGYLWYALLPGSNRTKNVTELTDNKVSHGLLLQDLKNLPSQTEISWNNRVTVDNPAKLQFSLPEEKSVKEIVKSAEAAGLRVQVIK